MMSWRSMHISAGLRILESAVNPLRSENITVISCSLPESKSGFLSNSLANSGEKNCSNWALGLTVNLASRLESSTKILGIPIVISAATQAKLPADYPTRRLGLARFPGVALPIDIFEFNHSLSDNEWHENKIIYEKALNYFETKSYGNAIKTLAPLIEKHGQGQLVDNPSLKLIRKCLEEMESSSGEFSTVLWSMTK